MKPMGTQGEESQRKGGSLNKRAVVLSERACGLKNQRPCSGTLATPRRPVPPRLVGVTRVRPGTSNSQRVASHIDLGPQRGGAETSKQSLDGQVFSCTGEWGDDAWIASAALVSQIELGQLWMFVCPPPRWVSSVAGRFNISKTEQHGPWRFGWMRSSSAAVLQDCTGLTALRCRLPGDIM